MPDRSRASAAVLTEVWFPQQGCRSYPKAWPLLHSLQISWSGASYGRTTHCMGRPRTSNEVSAGAQQILAQLRKSKGAYLFGARDTDAPFKVNSGSVSLSVPRQAVDELSIASCFTRTTTGAGTLVFVSFTVSEEGRAMFRRRC